MFGRGTGKPRGQLGGLSISRCGLGSIVGRAFSVLVAVGRVVSRVFFVLVAVGRVVGRVFSLLVAIRVVGRVIFSLAGVLLRVEWCLY